jgi:hypothetical protein
MNAELRRRQVYEALAAKDKERYALEDERYRAQAAVEE